MLCSDSVSCDIGAKLTLLPIDTLWKDAAKMVRAAEAER